MKNIYSLIIISLLIVGCEDFLTENPKSFISPTNFYETQSDAIAAINSAYSVLNSDYLYGHQGIFVYGDIASDIASSSEQTTFFGYGFDDYSFNSSNPIITGFYEDAYILINRANVVIENIGNSNIDEETKKLVIGEAKFLRALIYFNLARVFGDVPLKLNESSSLNELELPREDLDNIYQQVIKDLVDAENMLPVMPYETGRANKFAASALLSKVYLTINDFKKAAESAQQVINSNIYYLYDSYEDVFSIDNNVDNTEVIFEVNFQYPNHLNEIPRSFLPRELPYSNAYGVYVVNSILLDSYLENDKRKEYTIWTNGSQVGMPDINFDPHCNKFLDGIRSGLDDSEAGKINFPVIRYSEILLIYAEASNEINNGPTEDAYSAINQVRKRAGLNDLNNGLSKIAFRDSVLQERKLELAFEGHRWFDLKRTNKLSETLNSLGFQSHNEIYPIPQTALDVNKNLTQNPGY